LLLIFRKGTKGGEIVNEAAVKRETKALLKKFKGADPAKLEQLSGLIQKAAFENAVLKDLHGIAAQSGLVRFAPENALKQRPLPVSAEIARHTAAYTNVMDKLMKHLTVTADDGDDGLAEYE
jgi:hypothetical protein